MENPWIFVVVVLGAMLSSTAGSPHSGAVYFVSNMKYPVARDPVDYEARTSSEFASYLFSSITEAAEGGSPLPQAIFVLVSGLAPVSSASEISNDFEVVQADSLSSIKKVVQAAASSTVFTSVGQSCDGQSIKEALLSQAEGNPSLVSEVRLGGSCAEGSAGESLEDFLRRWEANKVVQRGGAVLLYCLSPTTLHGTSFLNAYLRLQNSTSSFAAVFVPEAASSRATCARSLISTDPLIGVNRTCDATCMTKATLLETGFVALVLLIALISGLCCLVDLDSPTRFEMERESS